MVQITHTATHTLPSEMLTGITDLEIRGGVNPVLYIASEVTSGITAWTLQDGASANFHTRSFFFVASAAEDGVTAYWMGKWGNVRERGTLDPGNGLFVDAPTALETAEIGGRLYLIVAGSGSGTLSVIQVNQWGGLFMKDHLLDDLSTRFAGVTALETVTVGQHTYLFAGGSDDGISMFEITADGQLHHLLTLADQLDTTLTNITAIAATVVGTELQVFVSGSEVGVTQFTVDLGALGDQIVGSDTHDVIHGTANDDVIVGFDGNDILFGGAGDDRIIDGAGVDVMWGESGADIFVFRQDRRMDNVMGFEDGIDKIDLTDFAMLYSIGQLTFVQKLYGVEISFGNDRFHIEADNGILQIADLTADDFIF